MTASKNYVVALTRTLVENMLTFTTAFYNSEIPLSSAIAILYLFI